MKIFYTLLGLTVFFGLSVNSIFAQSEREKAVKFYEEGDYKSAISLLKQSAKSNSGDADVWYLLGASYMKTGKIGEAKKNFAKVVKLKPDGSQGYVGLAFVNIYDNNIDEARTLAQKALQLNAQSYEAIYVLGVLSYRNGSYNGAYDSAVKTIKINPNYADAYLLKSEALTSSFGQLSGTVRKAPTERVELLKEAVTDLEKFISLSNTGEDLADRQERLESLKFFAKHYEEPRNQSPSGLDPMPVPDSGITPLKITSKPRAEYTDSARRKGVSGVIRMLVGFPADGKVKHILVLKSLETGLDKQAVKAAQKISFEPAVKNGQPISVVKVIEYVFSTY